MRVDKKYEQWKAVTESDFVTLFIKTWFTFIAVLRELNPEVQVFTDEGMPRGDKPFLNAYKDGVMPIVQRRLPSESIANELFRLYPFAMKKVLSVFPQYFFQTFFLTNRNYNYEFKNIEKDEDGKTKERQQLTLHIQDKCFLKMYMGLSGYFRSTTYNEEIKAKIDLRPIIATAVDAQKAKEKIDEVQLLRDLHDGILTEIENKFRSFLDNRLPQKGYNKTICGKITDGCLRAASAVRLKFEYNYRAPHEVAVLDDLNSYSVFTQMPFNSFYRIYEDNMYLQNADTYTVLVKTKGIEWFASFVYSLRNALFHEIISPLDEEWQLIFKSAYLILKQITDICIDVTKEIESVAIPENSPVAHFIESNTKDIEAINELGEYVELLAVTDIKIDSHNINDGNINLRGTTSIKVKIQEGNAEDIANDNGMIFSEELRVLRYNVTLTDDFEIKTDATTQQPMVEFNL